MTTPALKYPELAGPFNQTTVAAAAGIPGSTLRSWAERGFLDARELFPSFYEVEEQRRKTALRVKGEMEAKGEDASWIDETLESMKSQQKYGTPELLQACALAELTRYGITPAWASGRKSDGFYLLQRLTSALFDRAAGADAGKPSYLVVESRPLVRPLPGAKPLMADDDSRSLGIIDGLSLKDLTRYFAERDTDASTWIVVDVDALLRRIVARLAALTER